jgi:hypothetical protein
MNLRTEISLLGRLSIETVLLTVYSSQPQRAFTSKSSLHNYRPLRFPRCSHAQQKVLLSSFSASDNVLVTYVFTFKKRGCQIFSTLRTGGPLADGRQVGLDRAPDLGSGRSLLTNEKGHVILESVEAHGTFASLYGQGDECDLVHRLGTFGSRVRVDAAAAAQRPRIGTISCKLDTGNLSLHSIPF